MTLPWRLRPATPADTELLGDLFSRSLFVAPGEDPIDRDDLAAPSLTRYHENFGRPGDIGVVAEVDGEAIGAAWVRVFPETDRGYGWVDDDVPELSLAVDPRRRGDGVGTAMLRRLLSKVGTVSVTVHHENPARHLYQRLGFLPIARHESYSVMERIGAAISTALILEVPSVPERLEKLRQLHDPFASSGIPPHMTVLFPFRSAESIDDDVRRALADEIGRTDIITIELTKIGRFPEVVWLGPEDPAPLADLTRRLSIRFPDCVPYDGRHQTTIPHLTLAHGSMANLDPVEAEVRTVMEDEGPISFEARYISLFIQDSTRRWSSNEAFRLSLDLR